MEMGWKLAAMMGLLFVFGWGYNSLVEWVESKGYNQGYTSLLVVLGVAVTLLGALPLVGIEAVVLMVCLFVASGLPMVIGSVVRYARERGQEEAEARLKVEKELGDEA